MKSVAPRRRFYRERWAKRAYNPHNNIVLRGVKPTPKAKPRDIELESNFGSRDDVEVFREGPYVYVLSLNRGLNYVGLNEYDLRGEPTEHEQSGVEDSYWALHPIGEVFTQTDHEIREILGPRELDLREATIAKRLMPYLPQ